MDFYGIELNHLSKGGSLKIVGAGADKTILDGQDLYSFAFFSYGSNVTLQDLTIKNFCGSMGTLYMYAGTLTVDNCIFENCYYSESGGAIYFSDDDGENMFVVTNSKFISTSSDYNGGAICVEGCKVLILENNTFIDTVTDGCVVYALSIADEAFIFNNTFINITAPSETGIINIMGGNDCIIANNSFIDCIDFDIDTAILTLFGNYNIENNTITNTPIVVDETVFANNLTVLLNDGSKFSATFTDKWGEPLKTTEITFLVGKNPITATTDENGTATFDITQDLGKYVVNVTNPTTNESILRTLSVITNETLFADDFSSFVNDGSKFSAKFTDEFGKPLVNVNVTFVVGEEQINVTTDENGIATFEVTQGIGVHNVTVTNPVTDSEIIKSITVTVKSTIDANSSDSVPFATKVGDNTRFSVAFTDEFGKPLENTTVTFVIDGREVNATTDADGIASVEVKLDAGEHNVTVVNPLTGESFTKSATVNKTETATPVDTKPTETTPAVPVTKPTPKIIAKKATFKAKTKTKKYTVTLKDNNGKVMKKVKLTLKVGKKTYKATTNKKGKATFKITKLTKKGKYTAKISFKETAKYAAVTKPVKITVKK